MEQNILSKEAVPKLFRIYSIPAIISMLIVGTQSIIDGIFVGNFAGEFAMASVNIAQPFTQVLSAASMVVVIGSLSYMGRALGENNIEKTQNAYRTSLILIISIAVFFTMLGVGFSENIALVLGASDTLLRDTSVYIRIISIFAIPMFLMYQFAFSNRLLEKPDLYIKGMILSLVTNILLDIALVKYMSMGVLGAAIATGLAEPLALFYVIGPHLNKSSAINIYVGKFDRKIILPVVANGLSEAFTSISTAIAAYVFNKAFMKVGGELGIAAFTIISYINLFANYIMFGISDGIGPLISYNYGAGNLKRVRKAMKFSYGVSFLVGVGIFIMLTCSARWIVSLFINNNDELINLATVGAKLFSFGYLVNGFNILSSGYFTSIGLAKESIVIAISRGCIFTLIGIVILPNVFGINGIWMTVPFAELLTLVVCAYLLKSQKYC